MASALRSIHPSAWKGNSANFALTEFYEVRSAAVYLFRCLPGRIRQPSGNMSGASSR